MNYQIYNESSLVQAIIKNGGFEYFAKKINMKTYYEYHNIRSKGFWDKNGLGLKMEIKTICGKYGFLPSSKWFVENKMTYLDKAIRRFGGYVKVSKFIEYPTASEYKKH